MEAHIRYSIVIPVYNEEAVIHETYQRLKSVMLSAGEPYELLFVNDGSTDETANLLKRYAEVDPCVKLVDFSRNFGHQIAISAGMDYAAGDAIVVIDADLQDPPELILEMIEKWKQGYEVVYAKRVERKGETVFKKATASMFYRLLRASTDVDIPVDTGDFRLIDRKVCDEMKKLPEKNRFIRGLVSWVGFRQIAIEYVRDERFAGKTKYPLKKMLKLSMDGLTSFSYKPLKLAGYAGGFLTIAGFLSIIVMLYLTLFTHEAVTGWAYMISFQMLFCGIVLLALGVIGEYIGRIYDEAKHRPLYIVRKSYGMESKKAVKFYR